MNDQGAAKAADDGERPAWFGGGEGGGSDPTAPGSKASFPQGSLGEDDKGEQALPPEIAIDDDDEAAAMAEAKVAAGAPDVDGDHFLKLPEPTNDRRPPPWAKVPPAPFRFPRGIDAAFVRVRAPLTAAKHKGDRILIAWSLTDADEKLAYSRAMGDTNRAIAELSKQMIRAIDGYAVDWSGKPGAPGNIDILWRELGGKGRGQMIRLYTQMHVFDASEQKDFFENCVALVSTG